MILAYIQVHRYIHVLTPHYLTILTSIVTNLAMYTCTMYMRALNSLLLDMLYPCVHITDVIRGNEFSVATRHQDTARNTSEEIFQQSTKDMDAFIGQIHWHTYKKNVGVSSK